MDRTQDYHQYAFVVNWIYVGVSDGKISINMSLWKKVFRNFKNKVVQNDCFQAMLPIPDGFALNNFYNVFVFVQQSTLQIKLEFNGMPLKRFEIL